MCMYTYALNNNGCNVWHAFLNMPLALKGNQLRTARYRCMENGTCVGGAGHALLSVSAKMKQTNDGANTTDFLGHYLVRAMEDVGTTGHLWMYSAK